MHHKKYPTSLLAQTGFIIILISLLAIVGIGSSFFITQTIQGAGTTINASGMLRMLSYKIATQMMRDQNRTAPDPEPMQRLIEQFGQQLNHPALYHSIPKLELDDHQRRQHDELRAQHDRLKQEWKEKVHPELKLYLKLLSMPTDTTIHDRQLEQIRMTYLSRIDQFVHEIDQMVTAIEVETEENIARLHEIEQFALLLLLLAILTTPYLFYNRIITPLRDLLLTAEQVRQRNFSRHARYLRKDELGELALAFNLMISDLSASYSELEGRISEKTRALIEESNRITLMEERNIIAQELHDSLAQSIFYINIQASRLNSMVKQEATAETLLAVIAEIKEINSSADRQLRELISTFRTKINPEGIDAALEEIIDRESERCPTQFRYTNRIPGFDFSHNEEVTLVQIIQEATSNVSKHAMATHCHIELLFIPTLNSVVVTIEDDGVGLPRNPYRQNHFGLANMEERATAIAGRLLLETTHPSGTRVKLIFTPTRAQQPLL